MATRTRCRRSRGRSVLLWGVALFLLLQLAVSVVVDRYGMPVRLPEAVADLLPLASRPELADVIVLGSSRSYLGIDPQHATQDLSQCIGKPVNVFRAAIFAGDLPTEEYMLQRVLALGGRPRIALIEISPEFLARHNDWMLEHIRRQVTWENSPIYLPQIIHESKIGPYLRGRCLPLYAYRLPLWQEAQRLWMTGWAGWMQAYRLAGRLAGSQEPRALIEGQRPTTAEILHHCGLDRGCRVAGAIHPRGDVRAEPNQQEAAQRGAARIQPWLQHYETGGLSVAALERILTCCQRQGIVPLLIVPPLASAHRALYTPEIDRLFYARVNQLRKEYALGVTDYRSCLPDSYLFDNHHLTPAGSLIFTDLIVRELLAPVWREHQRPCGSPPASAQSSAAP
ncbi:MAG TPA: hypothetical protein VFA18_00185 [Gemmataceae bacterium]|nr:hypothetical protein [Gemmataceae bacterium]